MCGIVGMIGLKNKSCGDINRIYSMMDVQRHRGTDDAGSVAYSFERSAYYVMNGEKESTTHSWNGVIGFNRLSILDLTDAGHQPMIDRRNKVLLVFNGEIYNAFDLKKQYLRKYPFDSKTDTEVILKLYLEVGFDKMVCLLNGMFALCLIDLSRQQIYLARDRFGIIPLYMSIQDDILYFASEYKSILAVNGFKKTLDLQAVSEYLNFRSCIRRTMVQEIKSFAQGTYIRIEKGQLKENIYFDLNYYQSNEYSFFKPEELESKLQNAVKIQLISDVPLGGQLSGGIDSSLVSFMAKSILPNSFDTFSIIFDDERFTEEEWIDQVGNLVNVKQHKFIFNDIGIIPLIEACVWHEEAILSHPNTICIYQLTKMAKQYVTVLLSGEGADECFAGYSRFGLSLSEKFSAEECIRATTTIPMQLRSEVFSDIEDEMVFEERKDMFNALNGSNFDRQRKYEMLTYFPELLMRQNKMSMANSIENRVPFLDNDLVEYTLSLSANTLIKVQEGTPTIYKAPLKAICEKRFGKEFTYRNKMGFSVPMQNYIKTPEFRNYIYDLIFPKMRTRGIFNMGKMDYLYNNISANSYSYNEVECFWRVITAEIWCQLFLDKKVNG